MLREHFDFRGVQQPMAAESGEGTESRGAGNALVHQERKDGFVQRLKMMLCVLIDVDGYLFRGTPCQHAPLLSTTGLHFAS